MLVEGDVFYKILEKKQTKYDALLETYSTYEIIECTVVSVEMLENKSEPESYDARQTYIPYRCLVRFKTFGDDICTLYCELTSNSCNKGMYFTERQDAIDWINNVYRGKLAIEQKRIDAHIAIYNEVNREIQKLNKTGQFNIVSW